MSWPLSHEFNEAIQNPKAVFADPDLRDGEAVVGATGLPLPRSGNFADVYQVRGANGRDWAVKCFTRPVAGLAERYAKVSEALAKANLPFTVGFKFLAEGIRVGGAWRPVVKMEWVEGLLLNQVAREAAAKPGVLGALGGMWVKLCKRLRDAGLAHADLQHGNVLLVPGAKPGSYGLKLIDYDGVWVPALANTPSGEAGHPSFQHPQRAATRAYSPDVDRFPHLAIATALRGLSAGGAALWEKFDNGDNLLFTEDDYKNPAASKAMRELWQLDHPAVQALVGRLAIACGKPIPQTPWLDQFAPDGDPAPLDGATRQEAAAALNIALPVPVALPPEPGSAPAVVPVAVAPAPADANPFEIPDENEGGGTRAQVRVKPGTKSARALAQSKGGGNGLLFAGIGLAVVVVGLVVAAAVVVGGRKKPDEVVQPNEDPPPVATPKPKEADPPVAPKDPGGDPPPAPAAAWAVKTRWARPLPDGWKQFMGMRVAADGRAAEAHAGDGKLAVFDLATGAALRDPPDAAGIMYGVHVLDGGQVANTWHLAPGPLPVWDARAGKEAAALPRPLDGPIYMVPSPDGKFLAAYPGHGQGPVPFKLTDAVGKVVLDFPWTRGAALFTADSGRVLVAEPSGRCRWFKLPSGEADGEWMLGGEAVPPERGTVAPVAMSGDGALLVFDGSRLGAKHLFDGKTGRLVRRLAAEAGPHCLSNDGRLLLQTRNAGGRPVAELTDARTGGVLATVPAPDGAEGPTFALLPDGGAVLAVYRAGAAATHFDVARIDVAGPGAPASPPPDPPAAAVAFKERLRVKLDFVPRVARFDPDGRAVVAHDFNTRTFAVVDPRSGAVRTAAARGPLLPYSLVRLPGRVGVWAAGEKELATFDLGTGAAAAAVPLPAFPPRTPALTPAAVRVSPDGRYVAVGMAAPAKPDPDTKKTEYPLAPLQVLDTRTGKAVVDTEWQLTRPGEAIVFSPDSARVLVVDGGLRGRWYALPAGTPEKEWRAAGVANTHSGHVIEASADGRVLLCSAPLNGRFRPFALDAATGERVVLFAGALDAPGWTGLGLSADGRRALLTRLRATDRERDFAVADASTGAELARLKVPVEPDGDPTAALAPDGLAVVVTDRRRAAPLVVYDLVAPGDSPPPPAPPPAAVADGVEPVPAADPPALRPRWDAPVGKGKPFDQLLFAPDANAVLLGAATGFEALDAKGAPRAVGFTGLSSSGVADFFPLPDGRVGTVTPKGEVKVWNGRTGVSSGRHAPADPGPGAGGATALRALLSPNEKFLAAARTGRPAVDYPEVPVKVLDAAGRKDLVSTTWKGGAVYFTGDSARVFLAEWTGRGRWFALPSGTPGEAWELPPAAPDRPHQVTAMSADGAVLGYAGPLADKGSGSAVLDGKTGKPLRVFHRGHHANSPVDVSADGKRAALVKAVGGTEATVDVVEVATGARVGRARVPVAAGAAVPLFALSPDGRGLAVYDASRQRVHVFDVPAGPTTAP